MDPTAKGMCCLDIGRAQLFFKFKFCGVTYPCALIQWFSWIGDNPDDDTGMWMVKPEVDDSGSPIWFIVHLDSIMHATHLIGVYGDRRLPSTLTFDHSLDAFRSYYVNKYIDHHAFEIAY